MDRDGTERHRSRGSVTVYHPDLIVAVAIAATLRETAAAGATLATDHLRTVVRAGPAPPPVLVLMAGAPAGEVADVCEALGHRRLVVPVLASREEVTPAGVVADLLDGAAGVVALTASPRRFAAAVRAVAAGGLTIPVGVRPAALRLLAHAAQEHERARHRLAGMTPRQREVLGLMAAGYGHGGVAGRLGLSVTTARTHADRVRAQLGATSQLEAAVEARRTLRLGAGQGRPVEALLPAHPEPAAVPGSGPCPTCGWVPHR